MWAQSLAGPETEPGRISEVSRQPSPEWAVVTWGDWGSVQYQKGVSWPTRVAARLGAVPTLTVVTNLATGMGRRMEVEEFF